MLYTCNFTGSVVKNPSAMQETQVQPLDWEDALEKGMTTHSSILEASLVVQTVFSSVLGLPWWLSW